MSEEQWAANFDALMQKLTDEGVVQWVAWAYHDKDPKVDESTGRIVFDEETGEPVKKGLHVHALVYFVSMKSEDQVTELLGLSGRSQNCIPWSKKKDRTHWALYLTHSLAKARLEGKFEYDVSEVKVLVGNGKDPSTFYRSLRAGKTDEDTSVAVSARADFEAHHIKQVSLGRETVDEVIGLLMTDKSTREKLELDGEPRYPIRLRKTLEEAADLYQRDRLKYFETHSRCLVTTYIRGVGLTGKTELAGNLARQILKKEKSPLGFQTIVPHGNRLACDPVGNYRGELVAVASEFCLHSMALDAFKDMFDPTHAPTVNSRFHDKPWMVGYTFLTTSLGLEREIFQLVGSKAEKMASDEIDDALLAMGCAAVRSDYKKKLKALLPPEWRDQIRQVRRRVAIMADIVPSEACVGAATTIEEPFVLWVRVRDDKRNRAVPNLDRVSELSDRSSVSYDVKLSVKEQLKDPEIERRFRAGEPLLVTWDALDEWDETSAVVWPGKLDNLEGFVGYDMRVVPDSVGGVACRYDYKRTDGSPLVPSVRYADGYAGRADVFATLPLDVGPWTTVACIGYDPGDPGTMVRAYNAFQRAMDAYFALNNYDVTPETAPANPDLERWRKDRNDAVRGKGDPDKRDYGFTGVDKKGRDEYRARYVKKEDESAESDPYFRSPFFKSDEEHFQWLMRREFGAESPVKAEDVMKELGIARRDTGSGRGDDVGEAASEL